MIRFEPGSICSIILDRPEQRNALTPEMLSQIPGFIASAQADGARVVVLQGSGPVFCAGFDLKKCVGDSSAMEALLARLAAAIQSMNTCTVPVIVACHGAAIAGGCALLGGADIVVADQDAKLGYPVVRLGVSPAVSAPYLRQAIGNGAARHRLLDTELMTGCRAQELGLVHELVPERQDVLPTAMSIAAALVTKPPRALTETKAWLSQIAGPSCSESDRARDVSLSLVGSPEEQERLRVLWGPRSNE